MDSPKNDRKQMTQTSAGVDNTWKEKERNTENKMDERNPGCSGRERIGRRTLDG
jgi:hypothetical protein